MMPADTQVVGRNDAIRARLRHVLNLIGFTSLCGVLHEIDRLGRTVGTSIRSQHQSYAWLKASCAVH